MTVARILPRSSSKWAMAYAEHRKDWLRLGCELMVEEEEVDVAYEFLEDPQNVSILEARIDQASKEFLRDSLDSALFDEFGCSLFLYETPENA